MISMLPKRLWLVTHLEVSSRRAQVPWAVIVHACSRLLLVLEDSIDTPALYYQ